MRRGLVRQAIGVQAGAAAFTLVLRPLVAQRGIPLILGHGRDLPFGTRLLGGAVCASLMVKSNLPRAWIDRYPASHRPVPGGTGQCPALCYPLTGAARPDWMEQDPHPRVFNLAHFTHFSVPRSRDECVPRVVPQDIDLKVEDSITGPDKNCVSGTSAKPVRLNILPPPQPSPTGGRGQDGRRPREGDGGSAPAALYIRIDGPRRGALVCYRISDNGPGIALEYRERVFRIFERLTPGGEGTGIGLAIVRRIAESCGGRAWIEEAPGGGCRVLLELLAEKPP